MSNNSSLIASASEIVKFNLLFEQYQHDITDKAEDTSARACSLHDALLVYLRAMDDDSPMGGFFHVLFDQFESLQKDIHGILDCIAAYSGKFQAG